jgi:hypothetical protein
MIHARSSNESMAEVSQSRPFGLSDALLLDAATALGLALTRSLSDFLAIDRMEGINYRDSTGSIGNRTTLSRAYVEIGRPPASQVAHNLARSRPERPVAG